MLSQNVSTSPADPRRSAILDAAFASFARYGVRRTSMQEIAQASGLSRASLYLQFKNKQDILRALVEHYFTVTETRMRAALTPGQKPKHALTAAFDAKLGPELIALIDSPHGAEMLDAKAAQAADVVRLGEARLVTALADWLRIEAAHQRITLAPFGTDAPNLAQVMIAALSGQIAEGGDSSALRARARMLALVFARGLKA